MGISHSNRHQLHSIKGYKKKQHSSLGKKIPNLQLFQQPGIRDYNKNLGHDQCQITPKNNIKQVYNNYEYSPLATTGRTRQQTIAQNQQQKRNTLKILKNGASNSGSLNYNIAKNNVKDLGIIRNKQMRTQSQSKIPDVLVHRYKPVISINSQHQIKNKPIMTNNQIKNDPKYPATLSTQAVSQYQVQLRDKAIMVAANQNQYNRKLINQQYYPQPKQNFRSSVYKFRSPQNNKNKNFYTENQKVYISNDSYNKNAELYLRNIPVRPNIYTIQYPTQHYNQSQPRVDSYKISPQSSNGLSKRNQRYLGPYANQHGTFY